MWVDLDSVLGEIVQNYIGAYEQSTVCDLGAYYEQFM